jgi:hypothetical protein
MYYVLHRNKEGGFSKSENLSWDEAYRLEHSYLWSGVEAYIYPKY